MVCSIEVGGADSIEALAHAEGVTGSFVSRLLNVAFLAPDIVQRIAAGDHPPQLSAERLMRMGALPIDWAAQRMALGFAA